MFLPKHDHQNLILGPSANSSSFDDPSPITAQVRKAQTKYNFYQSKTLLTEYSSSFCFSFTKHTEIGLECKGEAEFAKDCRVGWYWQWLLQQKSTKAPPI